MRSPGRFARILVLVVVAGCTSTPAPSVLSPSFASGEIALPEEPTDQNGSPLPCGGYGFVGPVSLHGSPDDPRLTWIDHEITGERQAVVWPHGYRARFSPHLEVLDPTGKVVAREGDLADGACPMPAGRMLIEMASAAPGQATLRPSVAVTCGQIAAGDCHDAIFLVDSLDDLRLVDATSILVDDVCPANVACDRRYPFMAIVVLIAGPTVLGSSLVVGKDGPDDHAEAWQGPLPAHIAAAVAAVTGTDKGSSPPP